MNENSVVSLRQKDEIDDPLTEILRTGARKLIVQAVEIEFDMFLALNARLVLPDDRLLLLMMQAMAGRDYFLGAKRFSTNRR